MDITLKGVPLKTQENYISRDFKWKDSSRHFLRFKGTSGGRKCTIQILMETYNFWSHVLGIPLNLYIFKRTSNYVHFPFEMLLVGFSAE